MPVNWVMVMVFNATFNNISVISWRQLLLKEKTIDLPQVPDKLYHIMLYQVHFTMNQGIFLPCLALHKIQAKLTSKIDIP
jgi:hypothetical protein